MTLANWSKTPKGLQCNTCKETIPWLGSGDHCACMRAQIARHEKMFAGKGMMPGQEPYTPEEQRKVNSLIQVAGDYEAFCDDPEW